MIIVGPVRTRRQCVIAGSVRRNMSRLLLTGHSYAQARLGSTVTVETHRSINNQIPAATFLADCAKSGKRKHAILPVELSGCASASSLTNSAVRLEGCYRSSAWVLVVQSEMVDNTGHGSHGRMWWRSSRSQSTATGKAQSMLLHPSLSTQRHSPRHSVECFTVLPSCRFQNV